MNHGIKCFFGVHEYEVIRDIPLLRSNDSHIVGTVFVCMCKHCGKLKEKEVITIRDSYLVQTSK